jgi:hypothetical protein
MHKDIKKVKCHLCYQSRRVKLYSVGNIAPKVEYSLQNDQIAS